MKTLLVAASSGAAIALATIATPTYAKQSEHVVLHVERNDLDLTTAAGRKTYEMRITHAIAEMCPADALTRTQKACERNARAAVVKQRSSTPK